MRLNIQLGFFSVTSPKGKPFLAAFGTWLVLAWVSTGLGHKKSCKHRNFLLQMEREREHRERKGKVKSRGKMLRVSHRMAHRLSPSKAAWNRWEGIPSHPTKEAAGSGAALLLHSSVLQLLCCLAGT